MGKRLILTTVCYLFVVLYEAEYDSIAYEIEYHWTRRTRILARNLAGLVFLAFDVLMLTRLNKYSHRMIENRVLPCFIIALMALHVLACIFAALRLQKPYKAADIAIFFLRFISLLFYIAVQVFVRDTGNELFALPLLFVLIARAMRMLEGDWLDLMFEDFEK